MADQLLQVHAHTLPCGSSSPSDCRIPGRSCPIASSTAADKLHLPAPALHPLLPQTQNWTTHGQSKPPQTAQNQHQASSSIIIGPYCFSRTHTTDTKRKSQEKMKQNPQETKQSKLYFTCCKLKTSAPIYFSSSSSLSIYFWLRAVFRQSCVPVLLWRLTDYYQLL